MSRRRGAFEPDRHRCRLLSYDHFGGPADFVHTRNALHQLPDFWKVRGPEKRRSHPPAQRHSLDLRSRVRQAPEQIEEAIEAWMARAVDDPARVSAGEFAEHVRSEHSTFTLLPGIDATSDGLRDPRPGREGFGVRRLHLPAHRFCRGHVLIATIGEQLAILAGSSDVVGLRGALGWFQHP